MRVRLILSLWHGALAGEFSKVFSDITAFDPLVPPLHEMHIQVGIYFEMLHAVDDVERTFDAEFFEIYQWHDPRDYSELFSHDELLDTEEVVCVADAGSSAHGHRLRRRLAGGSSQSSESSSGNVSQSVRKFAELGEDEMDFVWRPDLQIANIHSRSSVKSKMMRFYTDGTIELIQLIYYINQSFFLYVHFLLTHFLYS